MARFQLNWKISICIHLCMDGSTSDAILITIIFLDFGICIHAKACSCRIHL